VTTFAEALAEHLHAIRARDIDRFLATVSRGPDVRVVGPLGTWIAGYEAVEKAHREWFATGDWSFEPQIMWHEGGDWRFIYDQNTSIAGTR